MNQRKPKPDLPWIANCPNALDLSVYPFRRAGGEYLLFLGRMSPDKGAHRALAVALETGLPLKIAAKCREPLEIRYFDEFIRPHLGGSLEYVGEVGHADKVELLMGARALINPIDWEEPFGLVVIEAMACGTPVIATRRGAFPEIIDHGRTGCSSTTTARWRIPRSSSSPTASTRRSCGRRSRSGSRRSTWSRTTSPRTRRRSRRRHRARELALSPYDREILKLALPALGALAAEPLYLLVDTAIVGHLGRTELAALGIAAIILGGAFAIFNFLQYGTTAQVARAGGAGETGTARQLGAQALWLSLAFGIGVSG